jgi:hypothetical protein
MSAAGHMPNLVVTNSCNLACPFCFASEYRADACAHRYLPAAELGRLVEYSGVDTVRLCGGEPTLHPGFLEMLATIMAVPERRLFVMTNGLWPEPVRAGVAALPGEARCRATYLVNVLPAAAYDEAELKLLSATLAILPADAVTLAATLYEPHQDTSYLFALAERFSVGALRVSIAAPNVTDPRSWLVDPERDFPALSRLVLDLVRKARGQNLRIHSDCGYIPPCFFAPAEVEELNPAGEARALEWRCHGPVDIGPDGEAWRCYGLYALLRAPLADFANAEELDAHFERQTRLLESRPLFSACATCAFLAHGQCGGGCHGFRAVRTLTQLGQSAGIDMAADGAVVAASYAVERTVLQRWQRTRGVTWMLCGTDGTWAELRPSALEARCLEAVSTTGAVTPASAPEVPGVARALRRFLALGALTPAPR